MIRRKCLAILSMLLFSFAMASEGIAGGKENVKVIANKVAEWQIANFGDNSYVRYDRHPLHWANGALYRGMLECAQKQDLNRQRNLYMILEKRWTGEWPRECIMQMIYV